MILEIFTIIRLLFKNKWFYVILGLSCWLSGNVSGDSLAIEGLKMIPPTIGVLLGGLLTTIAIIFGLVKDDDLKKINEKHGNLFFESLKRLKYHVILILLSLFCSLFAFMLKMLPLIEKAFLFFSEKNIQIFYFIQIFFSLMTFYSTLEVIGILFIMYEIKITYIKK